MWGDILHFFLQKLKKNCISRVTGDFFGTVSKKKITKTEKSRKPTFPKKKSSHRGAVTREIQFFFIFCKKNVKPRIEKVFLRFFFQTDPSTLWCRKIDFKK